MRGFVFSSGIFILIYFLFFFLIKPLNLSFISVSMLCITIGILINNLIRIPYKLYPGIEFSKKHLLKIGIIFLGARLSFTEVWNLGFIAFPFILITFAMVLFLTYFLIKFFFSHRNTIILISIGTAVCGITAILASAPFTKAKDNEIAYATFVITIIGTIALFFYPYIGFGILNNNTYQVGVFLGTSIHDTSQVIASSLIYASQFDNQEVINISTVTKLLRNSFLIILIPMLAWKNSNLKKSDLFKSLKTSFPLFVIGFLFFSIFRSVGDTYFLNSYSQDNWSYVLLILNLLSFTSLNIALVALGLSVDLKSIKKIGLRPLSIGLLISLTLLFVNLILIKTFIA